MMKNNNNNFSLKKEKEKEKKRSKCLEAAYKFQRWPSHPQAFFGSGLATLESN